MGVSSHPPMIRLKGTRSYSLWMSKEWFLEMESTGEDAVKMAEMAAKDLDYDISSVAEAAAGSEKTNSNFETSSMDKMPSRSIRR